MIWHYHDDDVPAPTATIDLSISGIPAQRALIEHYRVDQQHSNSYEVWKRMGSPQKPTADQYKELERAGQLQLYTSPEWQTIVNRQAVIKFQLPRQGVSLVTLRW
jgi:xylan 1,4-beta-xylosidase